MAMGLWVSLFSADLYSSSCLSLQLRTLMSKASMPSNQMIMISTYNPSKVKLSELTVLAIVSTGTRTPTKTPSKNLSLQNSSICELFGRRVLCAAGAGGASGTGGATTKGTGGAGGGGTGGGGSAGGGKGGPAPGGGGTYMAQEEVGFWGKH